MGRSRVAEFFETGVDRGFKQDVVKRACLVRVAIVKEVPVGQVVIAHRIDVVVNRI